LKGFCLVGFFLTKDIVYRLSHSSRDLLVQYNKIKKCCQIKLGQNPKRAQKIFLSKFLSNFYSEIFDGILTEKDFVVEFSVRSFPKKNL